MREKGRCHGHPLQCQQSRKEANILAGRAANILVPGLEIPTSAVLSGLSGRARCFVSVPASYKHTCRKTKLSPEGCPVTGMVVIPSRLVIPPPSQETEAGELRICGQPGLFSKMLLKKWQEIRGIACSPPVWKSLGTVFNIGAFPLRVDS